LRRFVLPASRFDNLTKKEKSGASRNELDFRQTVGVGTFHRIPALMTNRQFRTFEIADQGRDGHGILRLREY
jgi:hypothetical protein